MTLIKTFGEFLGEQYVYHASPSENHDSIKKNGITSRHGVAKNGNKYKVPINFAHKAKEASEYAKDGHVYRVKVEHLKEPMHDPIAGYVRTHHDVPAHHVEYKHGKKWKKL